MSAGITGHFIDTVRYRFKSYPKGLNPATHLMPTDFGKIRVLDTGGRKPVIINVPDGPNVIEHQESLIQQLAKNFRVVCFEYPGVGFSFPNPNYDYSIKKGAKLIVNVMDSLSIDRASLLFSCSNGFYAIKAAELYPDRVNHLFLSQTPSLISMAKWTEKSIPELLKYPIVGQLVNAFAEKKIARVWYNYALPKQTDKTDYLKKAIHSIHNGGCFCLSGLVQGLNRDKNTYLKVLDIPTTLVWGRDDFTHRKTSSQSIKEHLPNCEIIEFERCGHFPELELTTKFVSLIKERLTV